MPARLSHPQVLLLNPFDAIAGSQRVAVDVARSLEGAGIGLDFRLGFGSTGFVSAYPGVRRFMLTDPPPQRKRRYPLWLLAAVPRTLRAVFAGEVIWANTVYAVPAVLFPLLLAPRRVVVHVHEVEFAWVLMASLRWAARRGATLVCVSELHQHAIDLPATVLYNGVSPPADPQAARMARQLLFVGNTSPEKGFDLFIAVARALAGSGLEPVAFLPSPERSDPALLAAAAQAGVRVRFGVTDPQEMYGQGFLTLQCTDPVQWTETFSLVAVESISALVPVASAGAVVVKEVLGDALAFDCPERDPARIAAAVRALLADTLRHAALVSACRLRRERYSLARFQQQVVGLVMRLARGAPR
jgi:glycosyltransferase involved in cell wall biosynthesis